MTNIIIISGFLGSGKTTFINKLVKGLSKIEIVKEKIVIIENEFGDTPIDSSLLSNDIPISEIYSGCVCCSLKGELKNNIISVIEKYIPEYLLIEPSGISKLSEIISILNELSSIRNDINLFRTFTMIESLAFKEYLNDFGAFYIDQIKYADYIFLNSYDSLQRENKNFLLNKVKENNKSAQIINFDYRKLPEIQFLNLIDIENNNANFTLKSNTADIIEDLEFNSITCKKVEFKSLEEAKLKFSRLIEGNSPLTKNTGHILRIKGYVIIEKKIYLANITRFTFSLNKVFENEEQIKNIDLIFIGSSLIKSNIDRVLKYKKIILR